MKIIKENGPGNSVDHYREDWFTGNDKIFTALRESTRSLRTASLAALLFRSPAPGNRLVPL